MSFWPENCLRRDSTAQRSVNLFEAYVYVQKIVRQIQTAFGHPGQYPAAILPLVEVHSATIKVRPLSSCLTGYWENTSVQFYLPCADIWKGCYFGKVAGLRLPSLVNLY